MSALDLALRHEHRLTASPHLSAWHAFTLFQFASVLQLEVDASVPDTALQLPNISRKDTASGFDTMVNPGAFRGSRKDFLMSQKPAYAEAVVGGYAADMLANIQRKYFKRYPVDLPHDEEPTAEHLAAVNDEEADPDIEEPDAEKMSSQDYQAAITALEQRSSVIRFRKAQIKRWMSYQYMKDTDVDVTEPSADNPFSFLIHQLTGKEPTRPRKKTPVNVWRKTQRHNIEARVKNLAEAQGIPKDRWAALRDKVAREMFTELPAPIREKWAQQAEEESKNAIAEYDRLLKSDPSTKPQDRQIAIQGVVRVAQPILESLRKVTGWNFTLLGGGPEPAHGGKLNIISVHAGLTPGDVKMNFGRSERAAYKDVIVPIFGRFLKKCFSPEECRSRALSPDDGLVPLREYELEDSGATLDSVEDLEAQISSAGPLTSDEAISTNHPSLAPSLTPSNALASEAAIRPAAAAPSREPPPADEPPPIISPDESTPAQIPQATSCPTVSQALRRSLSSEPCSVVPRTPPAAPFLDPTPSTSDTARLGASPMEVDLVDTSSAGGTASQTTLPQVLTGDVSMNVDSPEDAGALYMSFESEPALFEARHTTPPPRLRASLPPSPRASPPLLRGALSSLPPSPRPSPPLQRASLPPSSHPSPPSTPRMSSTTAQASLPCPRCPTPPAARPSTPPMSLPPSPPTTHTVSLPPSLPPSPPPTLPPSSPPTLPPSPPPTLPPSPPPTLPPSPPPARPSPRLILPPSLPLAGPASPSSTTTSSRSVAPSAFAAVSGMGYRIIQNSPSLQPSSSSSSGAMSQTPSADTATAVRHSLRTSSYPTPPVDLSSGISTRASRKRRSSVSSETSSVSVSKRSRVSSTSSCSSSSPSCEPSSTAAPARSAVHADGAPRWFGDALLMLQMKDLGPQWLRLLEVWASFEKRAEYQENGKLGNLNRPSCIGDWIQRKRSTTWRPDVVPSEIQKKFKKWWISLQPQWRISDGKIIRSAVDGDWRCIRKPGLNGMYSVVAGLYFWGSSLGEEVVEQEQWLKVVEDVDLVIRCMVECNDLFAG